MDNEQTPAPLTPAEGSDTKKTNKTLIIVVIAVGLLLLAWGAISRFTSERVAERMVESALGGDVDVDYESDGEGTITITGEDGASMQYSAGGNVALPDNWPSDVPIIEGANLTYAGSMNPAEGEQGVVATFEVSTPVTDVASYYERVLVENGWTIDSTMRTIEATILSATKDGSTAGIFVSESDAGTSVTLSIGS